MAASSVQHQRVRRQVGPGGLTVQCLFFGRDLASVFGHIGGQRWHRVTTRHELLHQTAVVAVHGHERGRGRAGDQGLG